MADPPKWVVRAARSLPVVMTDSWNGPAAANRMLDAAGIGGDNPDYNRACRGFLVCDTANPELRSGYKLPFADIIDGSLKAASGGINAAAQRLPQTDIPDSVRSTAQGVIDMYKEKMGSDPMGPDTDSYPKKPKKEFSVTNRAYSTFDIKAINEDQRTFEGVATTISPDRTGDVVEPKGAEFQLPIPLLWQHDSHQPIGFITDAIVTDRDIKIKGQVVNLPDPGPLKDLLDSAWQMMKTKLVRGLSIGFKPLEEARIKDTFSYHIQKWLWLELSAVTIPANGECSITMIKNIDTKCRAALGKGSGIKLITTVPNSSGVADKLQVVSVTKDITMRTISEQIAALENTRSQKYTRQEEVMNKSIEEGRSSDAAEREEFDTLADEIEAIDGDLKRLRVLEKSAVSRAKEVNPDAIRTVADGVAARAGVTIKKEKPVRAKGTDFARFAMCVAAGKGNLLQSFEIAKTRYADDEDLVSLVKNAVNAGTTTDTSWAGNLVPLYQRYTGDFVEFLRPQTIIGKFGNGGIPSLRAIPFNVSIAGQTSGGSGYWVGEGQPKPLTRFSTSLTNLPWAKVANIAVVTEELLRLSTPSAETIVRDTLAAALIERLDIDFVDPNKAAQVNVSPASITYGVSAINSVGNSADNVRTDVAAALGQYITANLTPTTAVWIMTARRALSLSLMRNALGQKEFPDITMLGGMLEGFPVITSEYQHTDSDGDNVVLVNASDIWLADDGQVMIDASREASLQMSDTPTQDSTQGTGSSVVSMFQTNSVALRAERWINWQKRRSSAVVVLNAVNWGLDSGT